LAPFLQAQQDTSGLAVVLLTALAEKQWVEEDVLARDLNLPPKMVRKAMRYFEQVGCGWCSSCALKYNITKLVPGDSRLVTLVCNTNTGHLSQHTTAALCHCCS
jgi:hypothetical protein